MAELTDEQREQNQDQQIQALLKRVELLEERLENITESLSTVLTKHSAEAMVAVAGLKLYQADVVTDKSQVNDKTILCTRTEAGIEMACGERKVELERMPPAAQRAMQKAFAEMPSAPSFYVNLYSMD